MALLENILYTQLSPDENLDIEITGANYNRVFIKGDVTLTDNVNINIIDTPFSGSKVELYFEGLVDVAGNTLTLLGEDITDIANDSLFIQAFYIIDTWYVSKSIFNTFKLEDGIIQTSNITDNAITTSKIANNAVTPNKVTFPYATLQSTLELTSDSVSGFVYVPNDMRIINVVIKCRETFDGTGNEVTLDFIKEPVDITDNHNRVICNAGTPLIKGDTLTRTFVPASPDLLEGDIVEIVLAQTSQQGGKIDVFINGFLS